MATSTTEVTKTAAKKAAPVKATAKKAAKKVPTKKAAVKPRSDYKPGARVMGTDRFGKVHKGFVDRVEIKATGPFIYVGIKGKDEPMGFRPAKVRGF